MNSNQLETIRSEIEERQFDISETTKKMLSDKHILLATRFGVRAHPQVGEHIPSGEKRLQCSSCHKPIYSSSTCLGSGCHSSNNPRDD